MARCIWCNGGEGELRSVTLHEARERREVPVHPEHEASLLAWHARVTRDTQRFVTVVAFTPLALLAFVGLAALVNPASIFVALGLSLIALATFLWAHPYATPQTVRLLGVRRSIVLARGLTAMLAVGGTIALLAGAAALGA